MVSLVGCLLPRTRRAAPRPAQPAGGDPAQPRPAPARRRRPRWTSRRRGRGAGARPGCGAGGRGGATSPAASDRVGRDGATCARSGNLVFHLSLLGLLVGVRGRQAVRLRGPGHRAVRRRPVLQHRHPRLRLLPRRPARRRHGAAAVLRARRRLHRHLRAERAARELHAPTIGYQTAADLAAGTARLAAGDRSRSTTRCALDGSRVYLLGHGYAPRFTVTYPDGQQRTGRDPVAARSTRPRCCRRAPRSSPAPASPTRSSAAPASSRSPACSRPTSSGGQVVTSVFPALDDPEVAVDVLRGDLGLDDGRGQSIFTRRPEQARHRRADAVARAEHAARRRDHASTTAPRALRRRARLGHRCRSATTPRERGCWSSAVFMLAGLLLSLAVRRRRFWARLTPSGAGGTRSWSSAGSPARTARVTARSSTASPRTCCGTDPRMPAQLALDSDRISEDGWTARERRGARHLQRSAVHGGGRGVRARHGARTPPSTRRFARPAGGGAGRDRRRRWRTSAASGRRRRTARSAADPPTTSRRRPRTPALRGRPRSAWAAWASRWSSSAPGCSSARSSLRGLAADRWPLGNMYEFTSAVCLAAVVDLAGRAARGAGLRPVGVFVLLPVVILLFLGGTVLYARAAPVVPGAAVVLAGRARHHDHASRRACCFVPGRREPAVPAAPVRPAAGRAGRPQLPSAAALDRLAYRTTIVAFPLYTFGVIAGAIWAEAAWGRFWGWDPKETVAFVAWVVYAAYLHARATAGWRSGRAAWINVAGLGGRAVQPVLHQHGGRGPALVRGGELRRAHPSATRP